MRLPSLLAAAALSGTALLAPPAAAAPSNCVAVVARSCTYQSSGGAGDFVCAAVRCTLYVDGVFTRSLRFATTTAFWTSYGDVVLVVAHDAGAARAGDA